MLIYDEVIQKLYLEFMRRCWNNTKFTQTVPSRFTLRGERKKKKLKKKLIV